MIRRSTAFILGAGTSIPYGFPSGAGLLRDARRFDLRNLQGKLHDAALERPAAKLHEALQRTHDSSLDALLELRTDITPVGKRLIASLLLELEFHSPSRYPEPKDDWLTLFFEELAAGTKSLDDFARNPVVLITYNYDRLLEHRLSGALAAHYGRPDAECIEMVKKIPIIHLHGGLGPLPGFADASRTVPFGPSPSNPGVFAQWVDRAAKGVVIVHEARPETAEFDRVRKTLQTIDQVVMIGFGYGATNLSRLELSRWKPSIPIFGSVYDLTASRITYDVERAFEAAGITTLKLGDPKHGTREFLENTLGIFRR